MYMRLFIIGRMKPQDLAMDSFIKKIHQKIINVLLFSKYNKNIFFFMIANNFILYESDNLRPQQRCIVLHRKHLNEYILYVLL